MRRLCLLIAVFLLLFGVAQADVKGITVDTTAASLDLRTLKSLSEREVNTLAEKLNACPALKTCDLSETGMTLMTMAKLAEACPQIEFHFTVPVDDKKIDGFSETFDFDGLYRASTVKYSAFKRIMACLPRVRHVVMYSAPYSLEHMEELLALYPDVTFEWTLRFNGIKLRNTATAYSTLKGRQEPRYTAEDLAPLVKYCPDLLGLDVGHNNVSDLSFLTNWPHLRWLIDIDAKVPVTDLSPLAGLDELEYVELFMQNITDISPLANKTHLLDLNLCYNDITDLSPLYTCTNLERLHISHNPHLTQAEVDKLQAALPDCVIETETKQSTGAGWRLHPRYFIMFEGFTNGEYIPFNEGTNS